MSNHSNPHRSHPSELSAAEMVKRAIHDLRNPRHVIDGLTQILLEEEEGRPPLDEATQEILRDILLQLKRLEEVESDLLQWLEHQE